MIPAMWIESVRPKNAVGLDPPRVFWVAFLLRLNCCRHHCGGCKGAARKRCAGSLPPPSAGLRPPHHCLCAPLHSLPATAPLPCWHRPHTLRTAPAPCWRHYHCCWCCLGISATPCRRHIRCLPAICCPLAAAPSPPPPPCHPQRRVTFFQSPRSSAAPNVLSAISIKVSSSPVEDAQMAPLPLPDVPSVSPSPSPPPPFPRAPSRFRVPLAAPGNTGGSWAVSAPPCRSARKGTAVASAAGRRCGFCTGASTRNLCTGAGRFEIHKLRNKGRASNTLTARFICSTNQPSNRPFRQNYL